MNNVISSKIIPAHMIAIQVCKQLVPPTHKVSFHKAPITAKLAEAVWKINRLPDTSKHEGVVSLCTEPYDVLVKPKSVHVEQ